MTILAIDPGPEKSAWLTLGYDGLPGRFGNEVPNAELLEQLRGAPRLAADVVVIEKIASFGMTVGADVFETVYWSGRFAEAAYPLRVERLTRMAVKMHLCHDSRARDPNIKQALIDRFGGDGGKAIAVGTVKAKGPLHGIANDVWSALAVAVTWHDQHEGSPAP